jgi:hypothetical protein
MARACPFRPERPDAVAVEHLRPTKDALELASKKSKKSEHRGDTAPH